jgi:hypothetical protein
MTLEDYMPPRANNAINNKNKPGRRRSSEIEQELSEPTPLLFACPDTHLLTSAGIATDAATLQEFWGRRINVNCPHCGGVHHIDVRETFLNSALDLISTPPPLKGIDPPAA